MAYIRYPDKFVSKTDQEIFEFMCSVDMEADEYKHGATVLQLRSMERTARATKQLVWATWALMGTTALLLVLTALQLLQ